MGRLYLMINLYKYHLTITNLENKLLNDRDEFLLVLSVIYDYGVLKFKWVFYQNGIKYKLKISWYTIFKKLSQKYWLLVVNMV